MTKEDYILTQAKELVSLKKKSLKIRESLNADTSFSRTQKLHAEAQWVSMNISKTQERIGFALGFLNLEDLTKEYTPNGWQKQIGLKGELEKIKFD